MPDNDVLIRSLEREKRARKQAETLLEEKTREVFRANQDLLQAMEALREQSSLTQAIVETAAEGIFTFDERGVVVSMNRAAEEMFGHAAAEMIGSNIGRIIPGLSFEQSRSDLIGVRRDGGNVALDVAISPTRIGDRSIYTALVRDMTRRKELERQLSHSQKMESVGQLAAGIAHEINTPMQYVGDNLRFLNDSFQAIQGLLQAYERLERIIGRVPSLESLLQETRAIAAAIDVSFLTEEIPVALRQSLEGADRISKIVGAMREFSHPGVREKTEIDVRKAIESTLTVCRHEWKLVAEATTEFDPALVTVWGLAGEFNQAMLNLVVNAAHAIQARPDRVGPGRITISTRRDGDWAEIRVRDTGTGIPEAIRDRIFDPFFTTKPVGVGTGQGLAITYASIVDKHHGSIGFETELGVGTTFVVRLPIQPQENAVAGAASAGAEAARREAAFLPSMA